jgi:hypothetical protein
VKLLVNVITVTIKIMEENMNARFWVLLVLCVLAARATAQDGALQNAASLSTQPVAATDAHAANILTCPRCHNEMEEGVIPDHYHYDFYPAYWIKRSLLIKPHKSQCYDFGLGMIPAINLTKEGWSQVIRVSVFRCKSCGYLESYAK